MGWQEERAEDWQPTVDRDARRLAARIQQFWRAYRTAKDAETEGQRVLEQAKKDVAARLHAAGHANAVDWAVHADNRIRTRMFTGMVDVNPEAVLWAQRQAGRVTDNLSLGAQDQVRRVTVRGLKEGWHPHRTALEIARFLPLLPAQEEACRRLEGSLRKQGRPERLVQSTVAAAARQAAEQRAVTIARTEMMAAHNNGLDQLWSKARHAGLLPPVAQRRWIITSACRKTCVTCRQMVGDAALAEIGMPFRVPNPGGGYTAVDTPPLHPRCRCTTGIVGTGLGV